MLQRRGALSKKSRSCSIEISPRGIRASTNVVRLVIFLHCNPVRTRDSRKSRNEERSPPKSPGVSAGVFCRLTARGPVMTNFRRRGAGWERWAVTLGRYLCTTCTDRDPSRPVAIWKKGSRGCTSSSLVSRTLTGRDFERSRYTRVLSVSLQSRSVHKDERDMKISLHALHT